MQQLYVLPCGSLFKHIMTFSAPFNPHLPSQPTIGLTGQPFSLIGFSAPISSSQWILFLKPFDFFLFGTAAAMQASWKSLKTNDLNPYKISDKIVSELVFPGVRIKLF